MAGDEMKHAQRRMASQAPSSCTTLTYVLYSLYRAMNELFGDILGSDTRVSRRFPTQSLLRDKRVTLQRNTGLSQALLPVCLSHAVVSLALCAHVSMTYWLHEGHHALTMEVDVDCVVAQLPLQFVPLLYIFITTGTVPSVFHPFVFIHYMRWHLRSLLPSRSTL